MKIGSLVECVDGDWQYQPSPRKGNAYEVDGIFKGKRGGMFIYLVGFNYLKNDGERVCFYIEGFREIQFPPSLEAEIENCLTREFQEV